MATRYNDQTGEWEDDPNNDNWGRDVNPAEVQQAASEQGTAGPAPAPAAAPKPVALQWTRQGIGDAWNAWDGLDVGGFAQHYGLQTNGKEKIWNPQENEWWDLVRDYGPGGKNIKGVQTGHGAATAARARASAGAGSTGAIGTAGAPQAAPARDPRISQLYDMLLQRAQQGLAIDRNNPVIRQQSDAYAANEERARRNYLADLAESEGSTANLTGEQRLSSEQLGQRVGGFEAELMGRELQARRDEIAQALSQLQGLLTSQEENALRRELALIEDATQRYGIATNAATSRYNTDVGASTQRYGIESSNDQFLRDLALREWMAGNEDYYRRSGL